MTIINVMVDDQRLEFSSMPVVASEGVKETYVKFALSSDWSGFGATAIFYRDDSPDDVYVSVLDGAGLAEVPYEITAAPGWIRFGLSGSDGTSVHTSEILKYKVVKGRYTSGQGSEPPAPGIYEQMLAIAGQMRDTLNAALIDQNAVIQDLVSDMSDLESEQTIYENIITGRINTLVANFAGSSRETILFEGSHTVNIGDEIDLVSDPTVYDYLDIVLNDGMVGTIIGPTQNSQWRVTGETVKSTGTSVTTYVIEGVLDAQSLCLRVSTACAIVDTGTSSTRYDLGSGAIADESLRRYCLKVIGRKLTDDAEVVDIRVGANGTVYQTAGTAVRSQIEALTDENNEIESDISKIYDVLVTSESLTPAYYAHRYIGVDGSTGTSSAYNLYKVDPAGALRVKITSQNASRKTASIAFYSVPLEDLDTETAISSNCLLIGTVHESTDQNEYTETYDVPDGALSAFVSSAAAYGVPTVDKYLFVDVGEKIADLSLNKANKINTVMAEEIEATFISHRFLNINGLPSATGSANWDLYIIDVSDCDEIRYQTYPRTSGASLPLYDFISLPFENVSVSNITEDTIIEVGEPVPPGDTAIIDTLAIPDGARTMLVACATGITGYPEIVKYHYGYFDTLKNVLELEKEINENASGISDLNGEIEDLDKTLYYFTKKSIEFRIGGINENTGLDNALTYFVRGGAAESLKKGDYIQNDMPDKYTFWIYKYENQVYTGRTHIFDDKFIIQDDAGYRIMVEKVGNTEHVAFTEEEKAEVIEAVYFEIRQDSKIGYPTVNKFGSYGDILASNGDGSTTWIDPIGYSQEEIAAAVNAWLNDHPEATTSIEDYSLTYVKLVKGTLGFVSPLMFGAIGDGRTDDSIAIQNTIDYAVANGIKIVDGFGKTYIVSGAVRGDSSIVGNNYGVCIHGNITFQNFDLKLKDEVDVALTSVLNAYNSPGEKIIIRNVNIDGNRLNQNNVPSGVGQDGGFHGIRIGFTGDCGFIEISKCDIRDCYTDGICTRPRVFDDLKITDCYISGNGRNGITDNAKSSYLENCIIVNNGTRTAPRSGYHIEPDNSYDFTNKKIFNCLITGNRIADVKVYFNTKTYNVDLFELNSCTVGKMSWSNHGVTADCLHKNIKINDCIIDSIFYGNGDGTTDLNRFEAFEIVDSRVTGNVTIVGGQNYQSGLIAFNNAVLSGLVNLSKANNIIIIGNLLDNSGTDSLISLASCENVIYSNNISNKSEANTITASSVTNLAKSGNIYQSS